MEAYDDGMTSVGAVEPMGAHGPASAAKRLWYAFVDALVGLTELPPEPDALELADAVRSQRDGTPPPAIRLGAVDLPHPLGGPGRGRAA